MQKSDRAKARRKYEERALKRKSNRTGIPVSALRKPKHPPKLKKGKRH